jgi:hypothetical protein
LNYLPVRTYLQSHGKKIVTNVSTNQPAAPERLPFRERVTCSVEDASAATGLSRSVLYIKMKAGQIEYTMRKLAAKQSGLDAN